MNIKNLDGVKEEIDTRETISLLTLFIISNQVRENKWWGSEVHIDE